MPAESQQEAITVVAAPAAMQDNDATAGVTDDSEDVLLQIADNVPAGDERPVGATDSPGLLTPDSGSAAELIIIQHTVVHGDTLWHIARKYLGNPYRYPHLAQLSRISNPNLIYPGDVVTIEYQDSDADTAR
jgi:nucleoid-associated protein YgaU